MTMLKRVMLRNGETCEVWREYDRAARRHRYAVEVLRNSLVQYVYHRTDSRKEAFVALSEVAAKWAA